MSATVDIDESKWPRVYVTWPSRPLSDEDFEATVLAMSRLSRRGESYVIIHDARRAARPTPKQRAFAAAQQKLDAEPTRRRLRGTALVVSSSLVASVVTAVNWITPPPFPQKLFSTMEAAEAWATERLSANDD